jgi:hypothetical protein
MTQIKVRRGTTASWAAANPVLAAGEPGLDTTLNKVKFGDGATAWATLPFMTDALLALKAPLASPTFTGTVAGVTKTHVGLGNADNTSDAAKPVSTATQTALDLKANSDYPVFTGATTLVTAVLDGIPLANGLWNSATMQNTFTHRVAFGWDGVKYRTYLGNFTIQGSCARSTAWVIGDAIAAVPLAAQVPTFRIMGSNAYYDNATASIQAAVAGGAGASLNFWVSWAIV